MTPFDRQVLNAYRPGILAQEIVTALGLTLTTRNIARVLRSLARLQRVARERAR